MARSGETSCETMKSYIVGNVNEEQYNALMELDCNPKRTNYDDDLFSVLVTLDVPLLDLVLLAQDYEGEE